MKNHRSSLQEYRMTHNMSEDEPVKLDDIPTAFIQEALYDNFRPVQPLNSRKVYSSFKIEAKKGTHQSTVQNPIQV